MIGLVLVTHGRLAEELVSAMEHVVGPQDDVRSVCIGPDDDMERRGRDVIEAAKEVDDGSGVLIIADMFGGTPSNLAIAATDKVKAEVIAGVNLPMLIKFAQERESGKLEDVAKLARDAGRKYLILASDALSGRDRE